MSRGKGNFYEHRAIEFLQMKGYKILRRNFRTRVGEIDIIGRDNDTIAFIEVKARRSGSLASPEEAVNVEKKKKIVKAALQYKNKCRSSNYRFDVVTIIEATYGRIYKLFKNAFLADDVI